MASSDGATINASVSTRIISSLAAVAEVLWLQGHVDSIDSCS
jgi:hypothetical protein